MDKDELEYAWGWFEYHASQRLAAFNFFLIIVGFLLVGFAQAVDHQWAAFGIGLGAIGALVAVAFLVLDVRNEELVLRGRDALKDLESGMAVSLARLDRERTMLPEAIAWRRDPGKLSNWIGPKVAGLVKHKVWFRFIIGFVGAWFLAGAVWAARGYSGTGSDEICRESTVLVLHRPGFDLNLIQGSEHEGKEGGTDDDGGGPGDGLGGDRHVETVSVGNHQRIQTGRHCREEPVGGG